MAYKCPRCGGDVQMAGGPPAGAGMGCVGALVGLAFAGYACAKCGPIPRREFPPDARSSMMMMSVGLLVGAVVVLGLVVVLLVALNS